MNTIFNEKINNLDDAKFFIEDLVTNELSFNFEEEKDKSNSEAD